MNLIKGVKFIHNKRKWEVFAVWREAKNHEAIEYELIEHVTIKGLTNTKPMIKVEASKIDMNKIKII